MREVQSCSAIHAVQPRRARLSPRAGPPDAARSDPHAGRALLGRSPGWAGGARGVVCSARAFFPPPPGPPPRPPPPAAPRAPPRPLTPAPRPRDSGRRRVPSQLFEAYSQRLTTTRQVRQNIISLVGLDGAPVLNQSGEEVGHLVDLVARVHGGDDYPAITGMVVRVGRR